MLNLFHICYHVYFHSDFIWFHVYPIVTYHYHVPMLYFKAFRPFVKWLVLDDLDRFCIW